MERLPAVRICRQNSLSKINTDSKKYVIQKTSFRIEEVFFYTGLPFFEKKDIFQNKLFYRLTSLYFPDIIKAQLEFRLRTIIADFEFPECVSFTMKIIILTRLIRE